MNNPWPALVVGVFLVGISFGLLSAHKRSWQRQQNDSTLDERELAYYRRRHRRRVQTSAILGILGILIGVGDALLPLQKQQPLWPTLYWIGVLLLTGWVILLGLGDFWSTAAHTRAELARARQKQRELERQVIEFKHRHFGDRSSSGDTASS